MVAALTGSFRTHQRYLEAFSRIATGGTWKLTNAYEDLASRLQAAPHPRITGAIGDNAQIRRSLESAWSTELLLLLSHRLLRGDEIVRVSNNWNVVQAYYALYHATQAVLTARGHERPDSHPKTQRMYQDLWSQSPVELAPWSLSVGHNRVRPNGVVIDDTIHPWTFVDDTSCWSIACKALRSTRTDAVKEHFRTAREGKRTAKRKVWKEAQIAKGRNPTKVPPIPLPQLNDEEKTGLDARTRPYTLLDYLYRLRIRSNYVDSAMFTEGPGSTKGVGSLFSAFKS